MAEMGADFDFKVRTVKWFGLLSAAVILLMIGLGFWYLDKIFHNSAAFQSTIDFAPIMKQERPDAAIVTLGLEHDALAMRNKRTVSALYMRAYSQFLAIIAGAVLTLLGAVFVLARVDSVETQGEGQWGQAKWMLKSASPGVVITLVGAILIGTVVFIGGEKITAVDAPVFSAAPGRSALAIETPEFKQAMDAALKSIRDKGRAK